MSEFQLFFSGVESDTYFDIVAKESSTVLMSYHYLQRKGKKFLADRFAQYPGMQLMLDSGAHTFNTTEEYTSKPLDFWVKYLEGYTKFIRENREHIFAAVELDIDECVGTEQVEKWREEYFLPLEEEGIQIIYVWHSVKGDGEWERMCKKFNYVGFSFLAEKAVLNDMEIKKMFTIAKKEKSKVHGFAATGLDTMLANPYYSVDSTTWLVGTQFGEINYFDGRSMKRLKKDKWKRQYKNKFVQLGANWALAEREDPYELIRMNVLTFCEVEKYVRKMMRNKIYWNSKKIDFSKLKNFPKGTIPENILEDAEWEKDYLSYAQALGIDLYAEEELILTLLEGFYYFCPSDKSLEEKTANLTDEQLFMFIDFFAISEKINTRKKALEILPRLFTEHREGKRDDLNNVGDKVKRKEAQERDEYLEDDPYEEVEVGEEEVTNLLQQFLPTGDGVPDDDSIDEILEQNAISVVRDEEGKFLKGQKLVRKPKKLYSNLMPKMACDACIKASECPHYEAGKVCKYNKLLNSFNTRNLEDVKDAMVGIVDSNLGRMQRMMIFEMMDGGVIDPAVSTLMEQNMKWLNMIQELQSNKVVVQQRLVRDEQGNVTQTSTVTANPQAGGILSKIFGGFAKPQQVTDDNTIDVEGVEIEEPKK